MKLICVSLSAFLLINLSARAHSAVFAQDESRIYLVNSANRLVQLDLASGQSSEPILPENLHQGRITAVDRSRAGYILILQEDDLFAYDPATHKAPIILSFAKKLSSNGQAQKWKPEEFAYNPADGSILVATSSGNARTLWLLPKDENRPKPVFVRRVDTIAGLDFSSQGRLFFGYRGDLWCGTIASDPDGAGGTPPEHIYYLNAVRVAPIATLETDEATPSGQGVQATAAGANRIYLHSLRLGGSGFGTILSLVAPEAKVGVISTEESADNNYLDLGRRLELYQDQLKTAQFYAENGSEGYLCVSGSGRKAFYRGTPKDSQENAFYLIEDEQPPRKVANDLP